MTFVFKGGGTVAKKRLKKKQQQKKNIELLNKVGIKDKKQIKELKNKPQQVKKVYKKESRKILANERSDFIRNVLGLKVSNHSSKRYWSEERFDEWAKKELAKKKKQEEKIEKERKKRERQKRNLNDYYLQIYWKEKTEGFADPQLIEDFKKEYRHLPTEYIIQSINGFLTNKLPSLIGTYTIQVVKGRDRQEMKRFMGADDSGLLADWNEWILVYEGKADPRRYKELILGVHTVVRLLYDNEEKAQFIGDLIEKYLPQVNKQTALKLARDLNYRRGGF
jgi:hypothetical protein